MRDLVQHLNTGTIPRDQNIKKWENLIVVLAIVLMCGGADIGWGRFAELPHLGGEVAVRHVRPCCGGCWRWSSDGVDDRHDARGVDEVVKLRWFGAFVS